MAEVLAGGRWTESDVIEAIMEVFPSRRDLVTLGIGDDCAVLARGERLVTTDASVEGVHFDVAWMTLADAAYRCLTSNLSDVAAMGGEPGCFTLALGLRPDLGFDEIRGAIGAMRQCVEEHGLSRCALVGGDVVRSAVAMFSVTMLGEVPEWPVVTRAGARAGDVIAVLGDPGYAAAGLELCRRGRAGESSWSRFVEAFRRPRAQVVLGPLLARVRLVTAMMDTSDGIMTDLPRMLKSSGCGAELDVGAFVPDAAMAALGCELGMDPLGWMASGGEDFGLLVTADPCHVCALERAALEYGVRCRVIGRCTAERRLCWLKGGREVAMEDASFSHF